MSARQAHGGEPSAFEEGLEFREQHATLVIGASGDFGDHGFGVCEGFFGASEDEQFGALHIDDQHITVPCERGFSEDGVECSRADGFCFSGLGNGGPAGGHFGGW